MREPDSMDALLREWKPPEPSGGIRSACDLRLPFRCPPTAILADVLDHARKYAGTGSRGRDPRYRHPVPLVTAGSGPGLVAPKSRSRHPTGRQWFSTAT